jgi:hypothetical protein
MDNKIGRGHQFPIDHRKSDLYVKGGPGMGFINH